jgi:hypothetical protein
VPARVPVPAPPLRRFGGSFYAKHEIIHCKRPAGGFSFGPNLRLFYIVARYINYTPSRLASTLASAPHVFASYEAFISSPPKYEVRCMATETGVLHNSRSRVVTPLTGNDGARHVHF